jgi:cell division protein FtsW
VTGVQLPLISAGGTSLVLTLFIVGLLGRFARSEPAAIEAERSRDRGRLARLFLPVPESAVDPVRPRRRPDERPQARPVVGSGRTVVRSARPAPSRRPDDERVRHREAPRPPQERAAPVRNRRPSPAGAGAPRRAGGQQ